MQLAGEKSWDVRTPSRPVPMYRDAASNWLIWLADRSRENEVFRHDLIRYSPHEQHAQALAEAACHLVTSASPEEFLAAREQQQPAPRRVCTNGVFGPPAAVACVTDFPPRLHHCADTITVHSAGKKITAAAKAAPTLRMLLCGHPVDLAQCHEVRVGEPGEYVVMVTYSTSQVPPRTQPFTGERGRPTTTPFSQVSSLTECHWDLAAVSAAAGVDAAKLADVLIKEACARR